MESASWLRIAAGLTAFQATGHTFSAVLAGPSSAEESALRETRGVTRRRTPDDSRPRSGLRCNHANQRPLFCHGAHRGRGRDYGVYRHGSRVDQTALNRVLRSAASARPTRLPVEVPSP